MSNATVATSNGTSSAILEFMTEERDLIDIIWTCVATTILCTWVAVHPNMPAIKESSTLILLRRMKVMFWALLIPELILHWAVSQWLAARRIGSEYRNDGWTITHGFFLLMGGFHIYNGIDPPEVLTFDRLMTLPYWQRRKIANIMSVEHIEDKSKGDFLVKFIAILHTTWFIVQCAARSLQHYAITELELIAGALASLNAFMYFFWWKKPLDVQTPIVFLVTNNSVTVAEVDDGRPERTPSTPSDTQPLLEKYPALHREMTSLREGLGHFFFKRFQELKNNNFFVVIFNWLVVYPFFTPIQQLVFEVETQPRERFPKRLPTFYSLPPANSDQKAAMIMFMTVIGVMFGGLHLIAWNFEFPSMISLWAWRFSAALLTGAPLIALPLFLFHNFFGTKTLPLVPRLLFKSFVLLVLFSYIFARAILMIDAVILLKHAPASVFYVVDWTRFIPHIR